MAELDIRDDCVSEIDTIRFAPSDVLYHDPENTAVVIIACDGEDKNGSYVQRVWKKDIPNLIKALQKAQELWGVDNK